MAIMFLMLVASMFFVLGMFTQAVAKDPVPYVALGVGLVIVSITACTTMRVMELNAGYESQKVESK